MKLLRFLIFAICVHFCLPGVTLAQTVQRSFSFSISMAHDTIQVGAPAVVKVQLKNISGHDISSTTLPGGDIHGELVGFRPAVRDAQGKEPPLTKWGRQVFSRTIGNEMPIVLNAVGMVAVHPGEVIRNEISLHEIYDLSVPGKYTVQVKYDDDENKDEVGSNTITLTVLPKPTQSEK
jgi:hypothetical protein